MRLIAFLNEREVPPEFTFAHTLHPLDTSPSLTTDGKYYIFYHGTTKKIAKKIISSGMIRKSPGFGSGIATTYHDAYPYASMKAMETHDKPVVLKLEINKEWFDAQWVDREVGGHGTNQFLLRGHIPSEAIRSITPTKR